MASFYCEELLAPRPNPKKKDHPFLAVHDCLFNIFAATLHIGARSSFHNLMTRHAVTTGTRLYTRTCWWCLCSGRKRTYYKDKHRRL